MIDGSGKHFVSNEAMGECGFERSALDYQGNRSLKTIQFDLYRIEKLQEMVKWENC